MIPKEIEGTHVYQAIQEIRRHGVPKRRESSKFYVIHDGRLYPPKYVLSIAARIATGSDLPPSAFSGGDESNSFLTSLGFSVRSKGDEWSWKECYFAVWAYDQLEIAPDQVKTALYRQISDLIGRTEKAVEFKLQNVSHFDLRPREEKPINEAKNAQALLGEVFNWYWSDREAARMYFAPFREEFMFNLASSITVGSQTENKALIIEEGAISESPIARRKRSQKLLEEGRKHFRSLDPEGKLRCTACGFVTPRPVTGEIIQLHHSEPIYESSEDGRSLSLSDALGMLIPLCPTCHSLAHSGRPPLSVDAIRTLLGQ